MELSNYGVTLKRLTEDKIELVRNWRNDPKIQQFMEFRNYITPEMQSKWFKKIDNDRNYYFIIVFQNNEIGLINIKDIDKEKKTGEAGVFIYDDDYLNTDVAYRSHLVLFDYFFDNGIIDKVLSHIIDDNKRAIRFCQFLGGIKIENSDGNYYISKENYLKNPNRQRFIKKWNLMNSR